MKLHYYILSSTVADEITSMIPVSDEFIVYAGVSASQKCMLELFFDSFGKQSKKPKLRPPFLLAFQYHLPFLLH